MEKDSQFSEGGALPQVLGQIAIHGVAICDTGREGGGEGGWGEKERELGRGTVWKIEETLAGRALP